MAEADTRNAPMRACPDCGADVGRDLRYCPACGRFVPGARRNSWITTVATAGLWLAVGSFLLVGYAWIPIVGLMAEAALWGYVFLTGDWRVSGRRVLIGTGIGLALLAILAVVLRIRGVGA